MTTKMQGFAGFPAGKLNPTVIPSLFFSDLLPIIDNLAELKVTLYAMWALNHKDGQVRYLRLADFISDTQLLKGLGSSPTEASKILLDAIERAVVRGTFLHVTVESKDGEVDLYFLNTEKGRTAVDGITRGEWRPHLHEDEVVSVLIERPNIFVLYEQNIGALTPIIADELRDAEQTYPARWIEEAIELAVKNNVRKWRYVLGILRRWQQEGKQDDGISRRDSQTEYHIPNDLEDIIKR
jgi:DNA replication protein